MRGGRREGSPRLARSTRLRESSGEARTAPRAEDGTQRGGPRGPAPRPPPPGADGPQAPLSLLTWPLRRPAQFLAGSSVWTTCGESPGRRGTEGGQAARRQPGLEQPCSLPSAPGTAGPHQGHPPLGRPLPSVPSALSESQAPRMRPAPPPRSRCLGAVPRGAGLGGPRLLHQAWPARHREGLG